MTTGSGTAGPEWTHEQALGAELGRIDWADRTLILDFDETLWLRNSTEEFLAAARPAIFAAIVLQLLGFVKPWAWIASRDTARVRDLMRVWAVILVAPWSLWTWRRRAKHLGPNYLNGNLYRIAADVGAQRVVVASYGFRVIVEPLLEAINPRWTLSVAATLGDTRLRRVGKGRALEHVLGPEVLARSVVITDNFLDRDIGDVADHAFYVAWKDAIFDQAGLRPMLPFGYLSKIKRPKERYILNGVIGYDLIVLWLAFVLGADEWIGLAIASVFYLLAFFAVYEIGYHENDVKGLKTERSPVVSEEFHRFGRHFSPAWAWIFGVILAAVGAAVQAQSDHHWSVSQGQTFAASLATHWLMAILLLVVTRATFAWFNFIQPQSRIVPMLLLQLQRTLGYALILPVSLIGGALCVSHAIGRWVPYVVYRYGGSRDHFPAHLCSLLVYVAFLPILLLANPRVIAEERLGLAVISLYLIARATKEWLRFRTPERPPVPTPIAPTTAHGRGDRTSN